MGIPKGKGIRKINIDGREFYWTVSYPKQSSNYLQVNIGLLESPGTRVCIKTDMVDFWLLLGSKPPAETADPVIITPKFIREAIEFVIVNKHDLSRKKKLVMYYMKSQFSF